MEDKLYNVRGVYTNIGLWEIICGKNYESCDEMYHGSALNLVEHLDSRVVLC